MIKKFYSFSLAIIIAMQMLIVPHISAQAKSYNAKYEGAIDQYCYCTFFINNLDENTFSGYLILDSSVWFYPSYNNSVSGSVTYNYTDKKYTCTINKKIGYYDYVFILNINPGNGNANCQANGGSFVSTDFIMTGTVDPFFFFDAYNEDDMKLCMQLSWDIYGKNDEEGNKGPTIEQAMINIKDTARSYGLNSTLGDIPKNDTRDALLFMHMNDSNPDNVAFAITNRQNSDGSIDIFVIIRGTLADEWSGNTELTGEYYDASVDVHDNFDKAKDSIKTTIELYYRGISPYANEVNLIITGHSRGAAVANLYAKEATDALDTTLDYGIPHFNKVTAYTFACPNVSKYTDGMESYTNIYNFCFMEDLVTTVPFTKPVSGWNYWKYGQTCFCNLSNYNSISKSSTVKDIHDSLALWNSVNLYYNYPLVKLSSIPGITTLYSFAHSATSAFKGNSTSFRRIIHANSLFIQARIYPEIVPLVGNIIRNHNYESIGVSHDYTSYKNIIKGNDISEGHGSGAFYRIPYSEYINIYDGRVPMIEISNTVTYNAYEVQILKNFALSYDNYYKLNWDFNDPSSWKGIYWDENGHVYGIELPFLNLEGVLDISEFVNLKYLYVSGNQNLHLSRINYCLALECLDCSYTNTPNNTLDLTNNTNLKKINCDGCGLTSLNLNGLTNLKEVSFSFNNINDFDIDETAELETLDCEYNKLQIDENNEIGEKIQDYIEQDVDVVYYPQLVSDNATFNASELNTLKSFAQYNDNNNYLDWLDNNNEIDIEKVQKNVLFEYDGNDYRIVAIDIADLEVEGVLNLSSFTKLRDVFCENTKITSLNLSGCTELETLECSNCEINTLTLPNNATSNTSKLYILNCQNNHIDINVITDDIINQIEQKDNYKLHYKHQLIDGQVSDFDSNDYNALTNIYNQFNNSSSLEWDLDNPGYFDYVDWKYDTVSGKYKLLDVYLECLNITGNVDFSNSTGIDEISFSGSNITTIELPALDISENAFYDCPRLEAVVIADGSLSIGDNAFKYCDALQGVYIPNTVVSIAGNAFEDCGSLTIAGVSNSYAETYSQTNSIPFEAGYFVCGNVVVKETCEGGHDANYPVEGASVSDGSNSVLTDKYGYFVSFGLNNGSHSLDLTYPYGWDLDIASSISNSSMVVTTAIPMVICDYNTDNFINGRDYACFKTANVTSGDSNFKYYDINKDGVKNNADWQVVWDLLGEERPSVQQEPPMRAPLRVSPSKQYKSNTEHHGIEIVEGVDDD